METKQLIMPEKCASCGKVFDLWYELSSKEQVEELLGQGALLCWQCRKMPNGREAEIEISIEAIIS